MEQYTDEEALVELQKIIKSLQHKCQGQDWLFDLIAMLVSEPHHLHYDPTDDGIYDFKLKRTIRITSGKLVYIEYDSAFKDAEKIIINSGPDIWNEPTL